MKRLPGVFSLIILAACLAAPIHAQEAAHRHVHVRVALLSDTGGVDMSPYLDQLLADVEKQWTGAQAPQPSIRSQNAYVTVTIAPDGHILAMQLEDSQHTPIDKSAWLAVKFAHYKPTPAGMKDPDLKLRLHFTVY